MMEIKSEGAQSYTIPLDSMDLTYLSKYVRTPHAEKRPLWTRQCLDGESEYCRVQIVTRDDSEDCYSEETFDTFDCHICNVEVPILCFKRHNESDKHVTLKTIFQKVFERISKQINISVINNDKDIDKNEYYCVPCSKIIKIENKHKHESSQYHVKSQRAMNVVHEFNKIFEENKGNVMEILYEKKDLSKNNFGAEIIQNDTKINVKDVTNEDKSNNDETKTVCSSNDNTMKPTCTVEHLVTNDKLNKGLTSEENYFKDMVKKYKLKVNLPIVDGEFIHVASPSGVRVKIPRDHFHSYLSIVEGIRIYCQMCHIRVELRQESKHKVSEEHARNIFEPVNEQFGRSRNVYSSHCLICNTLVPSNSLSKHHLYNDRHVKLLNRAKLTDFWQKNEDLANSREDSIERTYTELHKIENHANKSEENYLDGHHNESGQLTKDAASVQKLVVKLCNVSVPEDQMEYHNAGTAHSSNALKKALKVADGLQVNFSKGNLKTDGESSKIPNNTPKNDNVAKQNDVSEKDNAAKQNDVSVKDNVNSQNDVSVKYNVNSQSDVSENDNVSQNDVSENDNVNIQNDVSGNDNVNNKNDVSEQDKVNSQNDVSENDNVNKQPMKTLPNVNALVQMCREIFEDHDDDFFFIIIIKLSAYNPCGLTWHLAQ